MAVKKDKVWIRIDELNRLHGYAASDEGFTVKEYAARYAIPERTARDRISSLRKTGELKEGFRYIKVDDRARKVRVYFL